MPAPEPTAAEIAEVDAILARERGEAVHTRGPISTAQLPGVNPAKVAAGDPRAIADLDIALRGQAAA